MTHISSSVHRDNYFLDYLLQDPLHYLPIPCDNKAFGRYERGQWVLVPVDKNQKAISELLRYWSNNSWFDWSDSIRYEEAVKEIEEACMARKLECVFGYGRSDAWELLPTYTPRGYFEPENSLGSRAIDSSRENVCPLCAVGIGIVIALHILLQEASSPHIPAVWIAERRNVLESALSRIQAVRNSIAGGELL